MASNSIPSLLKVTLILALLFAISSCDKQTFVKNNDVRSIAQVVGTEYSTIKRAHFSAPYIHKLGLPNNGKGSAIWGATGRDDEGNIYIGISSIQKVNNTAYLFQYKPSLEKFTAQSDVIDQLKKTHLFTPATSQNKLHSKFYQANDGYLYFTSFDEKGENSKQGKLPIHGGHLWRKKPNSLNWQHLLATQEALIALNTDGRYVYALGYWGHVLYQFDTSTQNVRQTSLDSFGEHVSRNFIVSLNGHIFVPKVTKNPDNSLTTNLVEFDQQLKIINSHPIEHYLTLGEFSQHGIVSYSTMKNGDIYFITAQGALYKLSQTLEKKFELTFEIFLDEQEQKGSYLASLFTLDGDKFLVSIGRQKSVSGYSWFVYELSTKTLATYPIDQLNDKTLIYGSMTRDNFGNIYVAGTDMSDKNKHKAVLLKFEYLTPNK